MEQTPREKHVEGAQKSAAPDLNRHVNEEMVRAYMADDTATLKTTGVDLEFSDQEIRNAMTNAARRYNGFPPFTETANPNCLPSDTNVFFDGIAVELLLLLEKKLSSQDVDYSAGGVAANLVARRLAHVRTMMDRHRRDFEQTARDLKRWKNRQKFFRHY